MRVVILIVSVATVSESPEVFQKYVTRYFSKTEMLGQPAFFGMQTLHGCQGTRGVAPYATHAREVGTREELNVLDAWIKESIAKKLIWTYGVNLYQDTGGVD